MGSCNSCTKHQTPVETKGEVKKENPVKEAIVETKHKIENIVSENIMGHHQSKDKKTFSSQYKLGKELGKGNYSTVREATALDTREVVAVKCIKEVDLAEEDRKALKIEIEILRKLDHPNIIKFYDFFHEKPLYYIVTEYVGGGELFDRIVEKEFYRENDAAKIIKTIAGAIKYLHDKDIVHRDLKPENILLTKTEKGAVDDTNIKLADFGFAKTAASGQNQLSTSCGTPGYVAPEILMAQKYGKEVDMWSFGVIIYILLCGYPPFLEDEKTGQRGLFEKIKKGSFSFTPEQYWQDVSDDAKHVVRKILIVDPSKRLTVDQLLKEPWLVELTGEASETMTAEKKNLRSAQEGMKQYQARKRWKKAGMFVMTGNYMSKFAKRKSEELDGIKEDNRGDDGGKAAESPQRVETSISS